MKVYKFGGAALSSADNFEKVRDIICGISDPGLIVIVSAIGKTTNALEKIFESLQENILPEDLLNDLKQTHVRLAETLISDPSSTTAEISKVFSELSDSVNFEGNPDVLYDLVVSQGEILSSIIVHQYLSQYINSCNWLDARQLVITDDQHIEANINWSATEVKILNALSDKPGVYITQGFIGSTITGKPVTLGRDGSDFSAAIFASCLKAESVIIWKDVPGVMNADPKRISDVSVFPELPYKEAAEMTYYGASVIHPKTIKPLANLNIPLLVKSFIDAGLPGTLIHECKVDQLPPLVVFKENQCLISCKGTDYTFITENQLSDIFKIISASGVRINVMQNSAISFSFCVDYRESKVHNLIERLSRGFEVYYNAGLTLITVKNYTPDIVEKYRNRKGLLLEQSSRSTLQILVR